MKLHTTHTPVGCRIVNLKFLRGLRLNESTAFGGSVRNTSKPSFYISRIAFDEQFNYEYQSCGFEQVGSNEMFVTHYVITKTPDFTGSVTNCDGSISVYWTTISCTRGGANCDLAFVAARGCVGSSGQNWLKNLPMKPCP